MEPQNRQNITEQATSYRRGLVLGLTMAEVGILIIFVLLLLIGVNLWQNQKLAKSMQNYEHVKIERLQVLENAESTLTQLKYTLQLPQNSGVEEIQTLVRRVQEIVSRPEGQSALEEAQFAIEQMRDIKDEIIETGGPEELADQVKRQSYRIANQEMQLQRYESLLREAGIGGGERPCWVKPDGTIEYLYDVVLTDSGIRMKEREIPEREHEKSLLPMPFIDPQEVLSQSEFRQRTLPLYERSKQMECRFFVVIYDGTGPTQKELYKSLLKTVEGHFYKLLSDASPPF